MRDGEGIHSRLVAGCLSLRCLGRFQLVLLCLPLYLAVAAGLTRSLILPNLMVGDESKLASGQRENVIQRREKVLSDVTAIRAELLRYQQQAATALARSNSDDEGNVVFRRVHALAEEIGATVRSFEQSLHSSEEKGVRGSTRLVLGTNFLQMVKLAMKLSTEPSELLVQEFLVTNEDPYSDRVSISLTISTVSTSSSTSRECLVSHTLSDIARRSR